MENLDNYRLDLSRQIKAEPDKNKRQEILLAAQKTEKYEHEALKHKRLTAARRQEQAPWEPFEEESIDENYERRTPKPEQIVQMDKRLQELGELFADSDLNWHLDGALNISLMNGKYIGNHKDVDFSVEEKDLQELEKHLLKKGYGLFLSQSEDKTKKKIMQRVDYKNFKESRTKHPLVAAINEYGEIREDRALNYVDAHIIERNPAGAPLGFSGVAIPEKWTKSYPVEFQGQTINLAHPGQVLYYKLHQERNYDKTDIKKLIETGKLNPDDLEEIAAVYASESVAHIKFASGIFERVANKLTPEMKTEQIFEELMKQPEFKSRPEMIEDPEEKEKLINNFQVLAQEIFESPDKSTAAIVNLAVKLFKVEDKNQKNQEELEIIRQGVQKITDKQEVQRIRTEIDNI